jgi:hypothetical protein
MRRRVNPVADLTVRCGAPFKNGAELQQSRIAGGYGPFLPGFLGQPANPPRIFLIPVWEVALPAEEARYTVV